jgi:hypothetical protein
MRTDPVSKARSYRTMRATRTTAFCGEPRPDREGKRENRKIRVYHMATVGTTVASSITEHPARRATGPAHDVLCQIAQWLKHP